MSDVSYEELRGVRVRYSTVVNYISHMYRLAIATFFTIIVTRRLSVEEYGLFTTIIALATMFSSIYEIWNFWIIRYSARKRYELVSSSFSISVLCAVILSALFLIVVNYYAEILGVEHTFFYIGCAVVFMNLFLTYFRSLSLSSKPFIEGIVVIIEHSARLILAYLLVVVFSLKLIGALTTVVLTILTGLLVYYVLLRKYKINIPKPSFNKKNLSLIFKNSYISAIAVLHDFFRHFEKPLITSLANSPLPAAFLGVSYVPRSVILQSSSAFTTSLSARLLRRPVKEDINYVIKLCILVNTGILTIALVFNTSILSLFREEYVKASMLFILFSIESYVNVFLNIFVAIASSIEREDLNKYGLELLKTALFKLRLYMFMSSTLVILFSSIASTILLIIGCDDPVKLSLPYPLAWLSSSILLTLVSYKVSSKMIEINIPWSEVLYSIVSSVIAGITAVLLGFNNIIIRNLWIDISKLILAVLLTLTIYFSSLLILSKWFRDFLITILRHLISIFWKKINRT